MLEIAKCTTLGFGVLVGCLGLMAGLLAVSFWLEEKYPEKPKPEPSALKKRINSIALMCCFVAFVLMVSFGIGHEVCHRNDHQHMAEK